MPEPCELALCILARGRLRLFERGIAGDLAAKAGRDLRDADRAHGGEVGVEIAREQGFDLLDRAAVEHVDKADVAAVAEPVARGQEDERGERDVAGDPALARPLPVGQCAPGRADDLERARDARRVGGIEARGGFGVGDGECGMGCRNGERADLGAFVRALSAEKPAPYPRPVLPQ